MMHWTKDQPTTPGWYWARWPKEPQLGPEILEITQPDGPDTDTLQVANRPFEYALDSYIAEYEPVEWQGPIEPNHD